MTEQDIFWLQTGYWSEADYRYNHPAAVAWRREMLEFWQKRYDSDPEYRAQCQRFEAAMLYAQPGYEAVPSPS